VPLHLGIVSCSAEGAALCYRTICTEAPALLGRYAHPEVSLHGHSFARYQECIDLDDWAGVAELMLASARKLEATGAQLLLCPDNTLHRAFPHLAGRSPLPWLHIAEVVAAAAEERGFRRLGLTGTRWLVQSEVYPEKLAARGLLCVRPGAEDREEINRIIMEELVFGRITPEALRTFQAIIGRMKDEGCDAVVLGCTEIPLLVDDATSPLPTLDSTRLLARAAIRRAIVGDAEATGQRHPGSEPPGTSRSTLR
jgi:aspartate racemase